ncbi:MAG: hypothetical protein JRD89_08055 [Deltaproteobacteria bacterium]|nr:hypothetical protein [Deltaproteobacteria bacterium]
MVDIDVRTCNKMLLDITEKLEHYRSARTAFDIADVIEANNLTNPDPIVFDREVAKRVMGEASDEYHKAIEEFEKECL